MNSFSNPIDLGKVMSLSLHQEPEVARATLSRIQRRSLTKLIAALVNEHEPLLEAIVLEEGELINVRERGGNLILRVTVEQVRP